MEMKCLAKGHTAPQVRIEPQHCDQDSDALPTELSVLPSGDDAKLGHIIPFVKMVDYHVIIILQMDKEDKTLSNIRTMMQTQLE